MDKLRMYISNKISEGKPFSLGPVIDNEKWTSLKLSVTTDKNGKNSIKDLSK